MASPSSQGRRRTQGKSTTEDQALNVIASEAEARLAAKRAARAEARIIRMKELERMQQEADEKMDREYQRSLITEDPVKQRTARVIEKVRTVPVSENEMNGPVSQETQMRTLQDNLREVNEKYKKAMVSNAQLDNEKQALVYQVDCLKDRLEEAEEVIENLKQEILDKTRDLSRISRENKNHIEELEKMREQLILRDKLLEEHGIPTDGSEQPDLNQSELTIRINDSVNLEFGDFDLSATTRSRESSRRSSAPDDRDSLLEQIKVLKEQVSDLRRNPDTDEDRIRDVESLQTSDDRTELSSSTAAPELEKSEAFEDVTDEAIEIRDRLRTGMIVNNNERTEDYDVIEQNARREGEVSNFEDRSYEPSLTLSESINESITNSVLESFKSDIMDGSVESEKPFEISTPAEVVSSSNPADSESLEAEQKESKGQSEKDLTDYDIVESTSASAKEFDVSNVSENEGKEGSLNENTVDLTGLEIRGQQARVSKSSVEEASVDEFGSVGNQSPPETVSIIAESNEAFIVAEEMVINRMTTEDEAAASDIVDIELPGTFDANANADALEADGNECFEELDEVQFDSTTNKQDIIVGEASQNKDGFTQDANQRVDIAIEPEVKALETLVQEVSPVEPASSVTQGEMILVDDAKPDIVDISLPEDVGQQAQADISGLGITEVAGDESFSKEDEDGFDNIEPDDIFVDAKSELSDEGGDFSSKQEEISDEPTDTDRKESDHDNFEEVDRKEVGEDESLPIEKKGEELADKKESDQENFVEVDFKEASEKAADEEESDYVSIKKESENSQGHLEEISIMDTCNVPTSRKEELDISESIRENFVSIEEKNGEIGAEINAEQDDSYVDTNDNLPEEEAKPSDIDQTIANTVERQIIERIDKEAICQGEDLIAGDQKVDTAGLDVTESTDVKNQMVLSEEKYHIEEDNSRVEGNSSPRDNFARDLKDKSIAPINSGEEILLSSSSFENMKETDRTEGEDESDSKNVNYDASKQIQSILCDVDDTSVALHKEGDQEHASDIEKTAVTDVVNESTEGREEQLMKEIDALEEVGAGHVVEIPDKDYPTEEINFTITEEQICEVEHSENQAAASQSSEETSKDQLITAFETRKRVGSFSPGSVRRQVSPEPVPKERKKKKKKNKKKGTVKMFVKELVSTSFDSEGSGNDTLDRSQPIEETTGNENDGLDESQRNEERTESGNVALGQSEANEETAEDFQSEEMIEGEKAPEVNLQGEDPQGELNKQSTDLKMRIQKLETENARLEGNSLRLETQVKRYKSQAEAAESVEDTLLADKRKLARELRNAQERIVELETEKEHLQKRVEKYKQRRKDEF